MAPPRDDETDVREDRDWVDLPMAPVAPGQRRRGRSLETLVAIAIVAVVLAIAKPWNGAGVGATDPAAPAPRPAAAGAIVTPVPIPSVEPAEALAAELCLAPSGWRMFATERWSDRLVRSWVGVIPLTGASGPEDPRIPFIDESSLTVLNLGYCSPISGPDRPPDDATTTIFRLVSGTPPGSPAGGSASPPSSTSPQRWVVIRPPQVLPTGGSSPYGGSWGPPVGSGPLSWPSGTFVFRIGDRGTGPGDAHWFGVQVEIRPPTPD